MVQKNGGGWKVGFIVNPIAGMGGRVGLKGTDGEAVLRRAIELGARPVAWRRGLRFLRKLKKLLNHDGEILFLTVSGKMGERLLQKTFFGNYRVVLKAPRKTTACDTKNACRLFLEKKVDIIVFVGGDGTARDVLTVVGQRVPVLGVPSGVKVYSSVFGVSPEASARLLVLYLRGKCILRLAEVVDVDEEAFRKGLLSVKVFGYMKVPYEPLYLQSSKNSIPLTSEEEENKDSIAKYVVENLIEKNVIYILGPGTTVETIAKRMNLKKTVLGVDVLLNGKLIARDVNEREILDILSRLRLPTKIIVSPLGREGFLFGRGNQQISPRVLRKVGLENIIVVATRIKLRETPVFFVDTGDKGVDRLFAQRKFVKVLVDYNEYTMVKVKSMA
ncbi:MAG: ATP-NAD kinase [Thermoprotei archaeon]|nr:MAG: ATP-NAD kinase [Thermoprotei archaeon]